ncbi:MAG TPA: hypothetical protein VLM11_22330 [Streptosporangiaceae bacterium]|nr:hypothetical protein [Streptosporangiaceae bacterium]
MQSAYSRHQAPKATAANTTLTTADVRDRLASLGAPAMPEHLAGKVADAISAESARRGLIATR